MNCFILLLGLWLTRAPSGAGSGWSQLFKAGFPSDASAALFVAFLLFILPAEKPFQRDENGKFIISKPLITWKQMSSKMSWGVIFLLGGGFAMASGITSSGNYSQLSLLEVCIYKHVLRRTRKVRRIKNASSEGSAVVFDGSYLLHYHQPHVSSDVQLIDNDNLCVDSLRHGRELKYQSDVYFDSKHGSCFLCFLTACFYTAKCCCV